MSQPYFTGYLSGGSSTDWLIPILDRQRYEAQFKSQPLDPAGKLSGKNARGVFHSSGLPTPVLSQIWSLVDRDCDGFINMAEFCAAQHLIKKTREGVSLPPTLPSMLLEAQSLTQTWSTPNYATQSLPRNFSAVGQMQPDPFSLSLQGQLPTSMSASTGSNAFRSLSSSLVPVQSTLAPSKLTPTPSSQATGGVGLTVSLATVSEGWSMTAIEKRRYIMVFNTLDKKKAGFLEGAEARSELLKSHLDYGLLAKIWELADVDKDGRLNTTEFCIALHLSEKAKKGLTIPPNLPPELLKEAQANQSSSKSVENVVTLEDKRRANWEEGQQELERRRQEIRDKQEKEKAVAEQKKRAAEEARLEKERQEAERQREREIERQRKIAMEQERERQRLLLQREAEERERERKQREEWTKQRCREMEVKCQVERGLVRRLQARRTDLEQALSQLRSTKEELGRELEHHRTLSWQYSDAIRHISLSLDLRSAERDELKMSLEGVRMEMTSLQSEHEFYASAVRESPESHTISIQQDHHMSIRSQLQNSLTSLRAQKIFLVETNDKTRQQQEEGKKQLKELNGKIQSEEKALQQLRHLLLSRKKQFEEQQKVEKQRLMDMKKKLEADRKLGEAKKKEEEKKRLEALQRKLEEQRKKDAQLQNEKWEAFATPPAVAKRTKKADDSSTAVSDKKEVGSKSKGPPIDDSWLLIDSPVPASSRTPPPRPRPYQATSGSQGSSPKPPPRSETLTVNDVVIQPIRKPPQKAPITQKHVKGDVGVNAEKGGSGGGDTSKLESGHAVPQAAAPSNAALKEKVRDMQEKRLKRQQEEKKRKEAVEEEKQTQEEENRWQALQEEDEARRKREEEDEARRLAKEEEDRRRAQEEEDRRLAKEEEDRRRAQEEEDRRRAKEEEDRKRAQENEARRWAKEEEDRRRAQEEEDRRRAKEEEDRRRAKEEEDRRRAKEEEDRRRAQENEARWWAKEEEDRKLQAKADGGRALKLYRALYPYSAERDDELSFTDGDVVKEATLATPPPQYWMGAELNGRKGLVPESYFEVVDSSGMGGQMKPPAVTVSVAEGGARGQEDKPGYAALTATTLESDNVYAIPRPSQYMNMEEAESVLKEKPATAKEKPASVRTSQYLNIDELSDVPQSEYMNFEAVEATLAEGDSRSMVGKVVKVLFSWSGIEDNQLQIKKDQIISITEEKEDWCMGTVGGKSGWFPKSYVEVMGSTQRKLSSSPMPVSPVAERFEAIYDFEGQEEGDLVFAAGDIIEVTSKEAGDWWTGRRGDKQGIFPANYVKPYAVQKQSSIMSMSSIQSGGGDSSTSSVPPGEPSMRPVVARVKTAYTAQADGQLSLNLGQVIRVRQQRSDGWWEGELQSRGQKKQVGWFPQKYVELLPSSGKKKENATPLRSISTASTTSAASVVSAKPQERSPEGLCSVLALYSYTADNADELTFHKGSVITVLSKDADTGWWHGELDNKKGLFPSNYVQTLDDQLPLPSSRWKECVSAHVLSYLNNTEVKRQEAIFELIVSEQSYTDSLKLVQEVFFGPMEAAHVLRPDEMARVKVNWSELVECSERFLSALMVRLRSSKMVVDKIGELLVAQFPNLKPHIRWCSCQLQACTILQNKTSNPFFREFEQKCAQDPRTGGLPLSSFLLKPMQRVTKYPLLMKRILEYTLELHPDKDDLTMALELAEKLCKEVNEGVRSTENTEHLEWLQCHVQIVGIEENLVFNSQTNFMGQRKLLHHGKLTKIRGNKPLLGFLFNDFLLLAKPSGFFEQNMEPFKSGHFLLYRRPYILDSLKAEKDPKSGPEAFKLVYQTDEKELVLRAESEKAKDEWIRKTWSAVIAFTQTKRQQKISQKADTLRPSLAQLEVLVVEAADLKASDPNGKSDPFCVIKFANQEQATHHIPKTLNPKWNAKLVFDVKDPSTDTLEVTVFDRDMFSPNDFLGSASISLQKLLLDGPGPWTKCLLLEDTPTGEITLKITLE